MSVAPQLPPPLLALSGGVSLDFDNTLVVQIFIFILLMFLLEPLLFRPVLRIFALREERTEGAKAQARELERVNRAAAEERDRIRAETAKLEGEILREARAASARIVEDGRRALAAAVSRVRFDVGRESERLAHDIMQRVLGREAN